MKSSKGVSYRCSPNSDRNRDRHSENFSKEMKARHHIAEEPTITRLGNILEEFNGGLIEAGERISDLETGQWNSLKESSKRKRMPKVETASYGTTSSKITFALQSRRKGGEKRGRKLI